MKTHITLEPGYYVGIRRTLRSFHFNLPKPVKGIPDDLSMDDFFNQLNNKKRTFNNQKVSVQTVESHGEHSTSFSGWIRTENARNLSDKSYAAPDIWHVAGGDDPKQAQELVKRFKKGAASVLSRCADSGEPITEAIACEINVNQCIVHEIKIILLRVSNVEDHESRFDPKTNLWYREKTIRKFYVVTAPDDDLLRGFAEEIADSNTNVTSNRKMVAVRNDKVTPRTGRNAFVSSFSIRTVSDGFTDNDQQILNAVNRIRMKHNASTNQGLS